MPQRPTLDNARSAIGILQEAVADFPFKAPHDFSATLAYICTLVARHAVQGSVPLAGISANTPGTGKGLLTDVIAMIGTGQLATKWPQTTDEEEERKRILTVALSGDPVVCIDNVRHPFGSAALDLALTAQTVKDRVLGSMQAVEAPVNCVFFANGNNMSYQGDTPRRVVPIELYSNLEKPEERQNFQHPQLLHWVQRERPRLVTAALTILRAFFVAGCPGQSTAPIGSFESWSHRIREALIWAGEADPAAGRASLTVQDNPELAAFAHMLDCWDDCFEDKPRSLADAAREIRQQAVLAGPENEWNALQSALADLDKRSDGKTLNTKTLGWVFRAHKGRNFQGKRMVVAHQSSKGITWKLERIP
jgi:hypothetical protein